MNGYITVVNRSPVDDHVALAEEHDAVAVGVRVGLVDDLHRLAVEQELALLAEERLGRPRGERHGRCPAAGGALMRFSTFSCAMIVRRRGRGRADVADDVAAGADAAGLGDRLVAADVVAVHVGVDDVADRRVG